MSDMIIVKDFNLIYDLCFALLLKFCGEQFIITLDGVTSKSLGEECSVFADSVVRRICC